MTREELEALCTRAADQDLDAWADLMDLIDDGEVIVESCPEGLLFKLAAPQ